LARSDAIGIVLAVDDREAAGPGEREGGQMATVGGGGGKRKASTGPRNSRSRGGWMADQSAGGRYERGGQIAKRTVRAAPVASRPSGPRSGGGIDIGKFLTEVGQNFDLVGKLNRRR
jgi:hypothetical protein